MFSDVGAGSGAGAPKSVRSRDNRPLAAGDKWEPLDRRSRVAKTIRVHIVLLAVLAALVMLAACSPPGAKTGQDSAGGGKQAQQDIAQASGDVCKVKPPNLKLEDAVVGFSQSEKEVNPFRIAETESIRSEAKKRNIKELVYTNANSQASKQISDIRDMIAQDVDAIIVAPLLEEGMDPALNAAKEAGIPVFLIDRETAGKPCEDYITFMGSDFSSRESRPPTSWPTSRTRRLRSPFSREHLAHRSRSTAPRASRSSSRSTRTWRSSPPRPGNSSGPRARRSWNSSYSPTPTLTRSTRRTTRWRSGPSRPSKTPARIPDRTSR